MAWAPDYVTAAEMRAFLRIADADDDVQIGVAIAAASRAIDRHTNRQFGVVASAEERFYTGHYDRRRCRWVVEIDDLMSTTGFDPQVQDVNGTDLGAVTYTLEPRNAAAKGRPWELLVVKPDSTYVPTGLTNECAFTGLWGWTSVPTTVKQACYLQASRFLARRDSPYGIAGSPDVGSELRLLARLDVDVATSLGSYMRWWSCA